MADIKITELPQATSVSDSDELIIQQPSGTKRAGIADLPVGSPLSAGYGIDITNDIISNTKPMNYEITGSVPSATPLNADQLQGHPASYFQQLLSAGNGIEINENVISSKLNMVSVWSNSVTSSPFAGQTINIDASQYRCFLVAFVRKINDETRVYQFMFKGSNTTSTQNYGGVIIQRPIFIADEYVRFFNASIFNTYASPQTNNDYMIPVAVLGIK